MAELTAFSRGFIETYNAEFKTETEIIGAQGAVLQVAFRPETIFKSEGKIVVKVPSWYDVIPGKPVRRYSSEAMLGPES
jgi:hypothetical protein